MRENFNESWLSEKQTYYLENGLYNVSYIYWDLLERLLANHYSFGSLNFMQRQKEWEVAHLNF